jgi:translocation and assembly module TamB
MRRLGKIVLWVAAVALALPIVLVAAVLLVLNTGFGRAQVAQRLPGLTGGLVRIAGLHGRFPDALRIDHIAINDANGTWLTLDDAALDWSPRRLVSGVAQIDRLAIGRINILRVPAPAAQPATPSGTGGGFSLPVQVDLKRLAVARINVAAAVAGAPASVGVAGRAHVATLSDLAAHLAVTRLDGPGSYTLDAGYNGRGVEAHAVVREPAGGLIGGLAGLTSIGAIDADANAIGPLDAIAARLTLAAGPLRAHVEGSVDSVHRSLDLHLDAQAPAMEPRSGIGWQSVAIDATARGNFTAPDADGTVNIAGIFAPGTRIASVTAKLRGNAGHVALDASVSGLTIPGPKPDLLAAAPLRIEATAEVQPAAKPLTLHVSHPLLDAQGHATVGDVIDARLALNLPDLAPFAAVGGVDLHGHTALTLTAHRAGETTTATVGGTIGIDAGMAPIPALVGPAAKLDLAARLVGQAITLDHLTLDGQNIALDASGGFDAGRVAARYRVALADLAVLTPTLAGKLVLNGEAGGPTDALAASGRIDGDISARGMRTGPLRVDVSATGLPARPAGDITARGALDGAPVDLHVAATRGADGALHVGVDRLAWKSLAANGTLDLPAGAVLPLGTVGLKFGRLDELRPLLGLPVEGSIDAQLILAPDAAKLKLEARRAGLAGRATVAAATLNANVADPLGKPVVDASLTADGIAASGIAGRAKVAARGPQAGLDIRADAELHNLAGADATVAAALLLDATAKDARVSVLTANWKGETLRLLAPVRIGFANGVALDRLRIGLQQAVLEVSGRVSPTLALNARLSNVTPDLAAPFVPGLAADGTLAAEARLGGTAEKPTGTIRLDATGLRLRNGPAQAIPPGMIAATATLNGGSARLDLHASAGPRINLAAQGTAPLGKGAIDLRSQGRIDLAVLDPFLTANGERARGILTLALGVAGTTAAPLPTGSVTLAGGDVQDFAQGAHIENINAQLDAVGETIRLTRLTAQAGPGTISAQGSVGVRGAMPVNIAITLRHARPLASDRVTVNLSADLTLQGAIAEGLRAGGSIDITRADLRVPDRLPGSVATIPVRRAGTPPPKPGPAARPGPTIGLDLALKADEIFVRGRGLDVELAGNMHLRGTAAAPIPDGGFTMTRGSLSLAGTTLTFSKGDVSFSGGGLTDPSLDFVSTTSNGSTFATLEVSGTASQPKITLSSTPELPQDEILAQILFHGGTVSPIELAEAAAGLAQFTGATGNLDPLESVRTGLGLDRLAVGTDPSGNAQVTAGRYVSKGVFVGARQTASGGTQATVQVDLYKGLKLEGLAGTGSTSATGSTNTAAGGLDSSNGSGVGLTYGFDY